MKDKKSLREKYRDLSRHQKIQIIIASFLTAFLLIVVPVYAWFSLSSNIETLTKIKAPTTLNIKAGNAYSIQYFELSDIDVTNVDAGGFGHKDYIFAVEAGSIPAYDIQLAHTTNIPFTYKLYRAKQLGDSTQGSQPAGTVATFDYHNGNTTISYYYGYASNSSNTLLEVNNENDAELALTDLNPETSLENHYGRLIAEKEDSIYSGYTKYNGNDEPEIYAVPLYSQHKNITKWDPTADYFILRLSWNTNNSASAFAEWNKAANNKETDMIYISAKASASGN